MLLQRGAYRFRCVFVDIEVGGFDGGTLGVRVGGRGGICGDGGGDGGDGGIIGDGGGDVGVSSIGGGGDGGGDGCLLADVLMSLLYISVASVSSLSGCSCCFAASLTAAV